MVLQDIAISKMCFAPFSPTLFFCCLHEVFWIGSSHLSAYCITHKVPMQWCRIFAKNLIDSGAGMWRKVCLAQKVYVVFIHRATVTVLGLFV